MKKTLLLIVPFMLACSMLSAQITYSLENTVEVGDTTIENIDNVNIFQVPVSGPNNTWNMTTLRTDLVDSLLYSDPATVPQGSFYPSATIAFDHLYQVPLFGNMVFVLFGIKNDSSATYVGMERNGLKGYFSNPLEYLVTPIGYGDKYIDTFAYGFEDSVVAFNRASPNVVVPPLSGVDSLRVRVNSVLKRGIDAWGVLKMPQGDFNVIRMSDTIIDSVAYQYRNSAGNWTHIPNTPITTASPYLDTTYVHTYISNEIEKGWFVLKYYLDANGIMLRNIQWNDAEPVREEPPVIDKVVAVKVPGGISPNGDGINDKLVIDGLDKYPNNKIQIFNRWGAVLFSAQNYQNDWAGTSEFGARVGGDTLPVGTYFYILDLGEEAPDSERINKGYIYLSK